jgi:hypothetical protein
MRTLSKATVVAVLTTTGLAGRPSVAAAQHAFFGEDLFGFPPSFAIASRATVFPNASAARAGFLAALTATVGTETFEGLAPGTVSPVPLAFPGAGVATLTGSGIVRQYSVPGEWQGNDRYPTSGDQFFDVNVGSFTIQFDTPVAAFGFFGVDIGDQGGQLVLDFISGTTTTTVTVPHTLGMASSTTGGVIFYGLIDTANPFSSVVFRNNAGGDPFAFDDMTIGSVAQVLPPTTTPEPATAGLFAVGLTGVVGFSARRRRRWSR